MTRIYFEDLTPGRTFRSEGLTISRDEILAFAREFDPQPFHTDEEAAKGTFVGELIASGWHTCALMMRLLSDTLMLNSSSMGAGGVEEVKWLRPVRPGDTLRLVLEVLEVRTPRTRPDRGFVHCLTTIFNQRGEPVLTQLFWGMFGRRDAAEARSAESATASPLRAPEAKSAAASHEGQPSAPGAPRLHAPFFEEVVLGERRDLGTYTFTPEDVIRFARAYDPQPFHIDPEAARKSHFGALCASGWHTGAAWMRSMVEHRRKARAAALADGQGVGEFGASPGFKDLKWLKPVYAGDTLSFASTAIDKRASASRPGWGLVFSHNTGDNQHGERVFEFNGSVFWQRRAGA